MSGFPFSLDPSMSKFNGEESGSWEMAIKAMEEKESGAIEVQ